MKAIIPCAGLGTRMGSITKYCPKELLPLGVVPILTHILEEEVHADIAEIAIIISPDKYEVMSRYLRTSTTKCALITQVSPAGLSDAVLTAREWVGDEPCVVMLPDMIHTARDLERMLSAWRKDPETSMLSVMPVPAYDAFKYGIFDPITRVIYEKPSLDRHIQPVLAASGRYILPPGRLNLRDPDFNKLLLGSNAYLVRDPVYDTGSPEGYIKAFKELANQPR